MGHLCQARGLEATDFKHQFNQILLNIINIALDRLKQALITISPQPRRELSIL
jgi:hypothetical protein